MADSEAFAQVTDQSFWLTGRLILEETSCVAVFPAGDSARVTCMQLGDAEESTMKAPGTASACPTSSKVVATRPTSPRIASVTRNDLAQLWRRNPGGWSIGLRTCFAAFECLIATAYPFPK
jgi:hypothetical protein